MTVVEMAPVKASTVQVPVPAIDAPPVESLAEVRWRRAAGVAGLVCLVLFAVGLVVLGVPAVVVCLGVTLTVLAALAVALIVVQVRR